MAPPARVEPAERQDRAPDCVSTRYCVSGPVDHLLELPVQIGSPEFFRVTDFVDWSRDKRLELNPDFQRRAVWNQDIKSYLVNSILMGFPMPKVYMRTKIDTTSQKTVREVVDGQQRIRTILEFASNSLRLNKRAAQYSGLRYQDLSNDDKQAFLSYTISVEQLVNASNNVVLEIFYRLNTYSVPLNAAELRNAQHNGEFKFAVRDSSVSLTWFWDKYEILSTRQRLRMADDELVAEMYGVLIDGVKNAGKPYLDRLYQRFDARFTDAQNISEKMTTVISFMDKNLSPAMQDELFSRPPQFLMLFAVVAHKLYDLPPGDLGDDLPTRQRDRSLDTERAVINLLNLSAAVAQDPPPSDVADFAFASRGATVRISSRRVRFREIWNAINDTF